jgi:hypothetical protein
MLKQEEIVKIKGEDSKKILSVANIEDAVLGARTSEIRKKFQAIKDKIQTLIDKKAEVLSLPYSKAETLELALDALKENRKKWFFDELLVPHLKDCQEARGGATFLDPNNVRVHLFTERNIWKLAYQIITESDVRAAIEMLPDPDIGISSSERTRQIKKLESEISALENQAEELKKL